MFCIGYSILKCMCIMVLILNVVCTFAWYLEGSRFKCLYRDWLSCLFFFLLYPVSLDRYLYATLKYVMAVSNLLFADVLII
jgi:hypothetical protein